MARTHARIQYRIWSDPDWRALSRDAQWLYTALLSSPKLTLAGSIDLKERSWASLAADTTTGDIDAALAELEAAQFIAVDRTTDELVLRTFVANDGLCKTPNVAKGMWRAWDAIESHTLRQVVLAHLPDDAFTPSANPSVGPLTALPETLEHDPDQLIPEGFPKPFPEGFPEGFPKPSYPQATTPAPAPAITPPTPPSRRDPTPTPTR